jgi:DNA-binding CsgD family transcriptional regulator/tetratricopeptide (TPR) repeat protein
VFAGGWSLEAAESICSDAGLASDAVLDLLSGLVEKSLVLTAEQGAEIRYRFLESLREYAADKLRDAGEEALLRNQHGTWHLALAERAEPELTGPHQETWLNRLDRERENLRAAQRWALERGDTETVARLGAALWHFWWARADAADAHEWVDAIVPLARQMPPTLAQARALRGAGLLAGSLADYATCRSLLGEGLAIARQLDDRGLLASLLDSLGRQSFVEARYDEARMLLNEGLAIFREIDDRHGLARALSHLGFLDYLEGRQEAARATYREGLAVARDADDPNAVAEFFDNLGRTFHAERDLDAAIRMYQEAEVIWREIGQGPRLAMVLNNLGSVHTLRGELTTARAQLAEALSLAQRIGNRRRLAFTLAAIATLAAVAGEAERAVRLDAIASAAVAEMGASLAQPIHMLGVQHLERARHVAGPSASSPVAGRTMSLAQAVEETLAWFAELASSTQGDGQPALQEPGPSASPQAPSGTGGLSPRELEVAALVARGMTNRQIATELVITEGTAANHVKHILARLAFDSRTQIAAWVVERGLSSSSPV